MRLIHVSDWHLGRMTYGQTREPDHKAVLEEIVGITREFKPHLIIHSGDLYEGARPAYPDMQMGIDVLRELAAIAPVVVVRGNHDSAALFRVFNLLLGDGSRIRFVDRPIPPAEGGILEYEGEEGERIRLAALPFIHANRVIAGFEDAAGWTSVYANRIAMVEEALQAGLHRGYSPKKDILLFAAHLFVEGAIAAKSERQFHVGSDYATRLDNLPQVSYAAFGHIHRPQALPGSIVVGRYAGSPIPLDFGEEGEKKEIVLVEARPGRPASVTPVELKAGRKLRRIEGTLEEIKVMADGVDDALVLVIVNTKEPEQNLAQQVRALLPAATLLNVSENCAARRTELISAAAGDTVAAEPSLADMFLEYLGTRGVVGSTVEKTREVFDRLLVASETEEPPHFEVLSGLIKTVQLDGTESDKIRAVGATSA